MEGRDGKNGYGDYDATDSQKTHVLWEDRRAQRQRDRERLERGRRPLAVVVDELEDDKRERSELRQRIVDTFKAVAFLVSLMGAAFGAYSGYLALFAAH